MKLNNYIVRFVCKINVKFWIFTKKVEIYSVEIEGTTPYFYGNYHDCYCEAEFKAEFFNTTVIYDVPGM